MNRFRKQDSLKMNLILLGIVLILGTILLISGIFVKKRFDEMKREGLLKEKTEEKTEENTTDLTEASGLYGGITHGLVDIIGIYNQTKIIVATGAEPEFMTDGAAIESVDGVVYEADAYKHLTLRSEPSLSGKPAALLPALTQMMIVEHTNDKMVKVVVLDNNMTGYVDINHIRPQGEELQYVGYSAPEIVTPESVIYADVFESLTLRSSASTSSSALDLLLPCTPMHVVERIDNMAKVVIIETGQTGYVNTDYVSADVNNFIRAGK